MLCEALAGMALFACLAREPDCLPPDTPDMVVADLPAIGQQESGLRPYVIRDETTRESFFPETYAEAVRIAKVRDAAGHVLGLGAWQITHRSNWVRHGLTVETALTPCGSIRAAAAHYTGNLRDAALQMYNSGRPNGAPAYAASVMGRAARLSAAPIPLATAPVMLPARLAAPAAPVPPTGAMDAYARAQAAGADAYTRGAQAPR